MGGMNLCRAASGGDLTLRHIYLILCAVALACLVLGWLLGHPIMILGYFALLLLSVPGCLIGDLWGVREGTTEGYYLIAAGLAINILFLQWLKQRNDNRSRR